MAELVGIGGDSGSGKSTSIRTLDPKQTIIINSDKKSLPFKGWKKLYNKENKNYYEVSDMAHIKDFLSTLSESRPEVKYVVLDVVNRCMLDKMMSDRTVKGYDKWLTLAGEVYDMLVAAKEQVSDDVIVFAMFHTEIENGIQKIKTVGKMVDEKIKIESLLTVMLTTLIERGTGANAKAKYQFQTQSQGNSTAKSPEGMFENLYIPNDLNYVAEQVRAYQEA